MITKKNNFIDELRIPNGVIVYNDFGIDESVPFSDQWYRYKEDILQIKFGDSFILDVGWYPECEPEGNFVVRAIKNEDWWPSFAKESARNLSELKQAIEKMAILINKQLVK